MGIGVVHTGGSVKSSRCAGLTYSLLWTVSFYAALPGRFIGMGQFDDRSADAFEEEVEEIEEVVPARAVLTELARGFLLAHDSDPAQALKFAVTFLQEQTGRARPVRVEPVDRVTMARLSLGRFPQGAVERVDR